MMNNNRMQAYLAASFASKRSYGLLLAGLLVAVWAGSGYAEDAPSNDPLARLQALQAQIKAQQASNNEALVQQSAVQTAAGRQPPSLAASMVNKAPISAQQRKASAPPAPPSGPNLDLTLNTTKKNLQEEAFGGVLDNMMPLSPAQIHELRSAYNAVQRSAAAEAGTPARPTSSAMVVDLSPGATPPIVRLGAGYVTSLVMLDATGAPWPIEAYDIGDPRSFNIHWDKKSNTLLIQSISFFKQGNLAVLLRGLNTPVMITLLPGQKVVDYRVDMRVPGMGPEARLTAQAMPGTANPALLNVLNGLGPDKAQRLHLLGGEGQIWLANHQLYLRTPLTVVSPSWSSMMSDSDDTMHAYQLPQASVILALQHGKLVKLSVEGL